ncbi:MAG: hypothetical protein ACK4Z6_05540 [Candidatus Methylomirabilales bacterium]
MRRTSDPSTSLRASLEALREEVSLLRREFEALKQKLEEPLSLEGALHRRGLRVHRADPWEGLAFPRGLDPAFEEELYERLKKYSFRLFFRDVIKRKASFKASDLGRFCSPDVVQEYLDFLLKGGIIERQNTSFRLVAKGVRSFGETLEWFVAQVFRREFKAPAFWGIRLQEVGTGGDYDVLALVEGRLVYVEVKSSPPKHIEQEEVDAFWDRVQALFPSLAIFLVDTELRMKDKMVVMFEDLLKRRFGRKWRAHPVTRLVDELFVLEGRIVIANAKPSLIGNLGRCLGWWLSRRE